MKLFPYCVGSNEFFSVPNSFPFNLAAYSFIAEYVGKAP